MPEISGLYLQGEEDGEETEQRERVHGKENQYVTVVCCFDLKIIDFSFSCCCIEITVLPNMVSPSHVENTTCLRSPSFNLPPK